jgi:hypothetical protein
MRLRSVTEQRALVMLNEVKHLGHEWNLTLVLVLSPDPLLALRACPERSRRDDRRGAQTPQKLVARYVVMHTAATAD